MPTQTALARLAAELRGLPGSVAEIEIVRAANQRFHNRFVARLCDDAIREMQATQPKESEVPKLTPQQQADAWNERVNVGDQVDYAEVIGEKPTRYTTSTIAQVLSGHTAMVWLEGKRGCVAITHCTLVPKAPAIELQPIESSQLHSIGHDAATNTLAIRFKSKGAAASLYHYANFTAADFAAFLAADSKGSHFKQHIKPAADKHPYTKIDSGAAA